MIRERGCRVVPEEVNHTKYAYIIGKRYGMNAARVVGRSSPGTLTASEADAEFERLRKREEGSVDGSEVMEEIDSNGRGDDFWEGARDGFVKEVRDRDREETQDTDAK